MRCSVRYETTVVTAIILVWLEAYIHLSEICHSCPQLWRVNKVLQFARVKVKTWKIVVPMLVMFVASILVLVLWTAVESHDWVRHTIDELTGETYGNSGNMDEDDNWGWFMATILTSGFPVVMALVMAWKTKDVEDSFSESWWIFSLVFVQVQVSLQFFRIFSLHPMNLNLLECCWQALLVVFLSFPL